MAIDAKKNTQNESAGNQKDRKIDRKHKTDDAFCIVIGPSFDRIWDTIWPEILEDKIS